MRKNIIIKTGQMPFPFIKIIFSNFLLRCL